MRAGDNSSSIFNVAIAVIQNAVSPGGELKKTKNKLVWFRRDFFSPGDYSD